MLADFYLHYQPIYRLRSGKLIGVEALLRHPSGVSPLELLKRAREEGLIPSWELTVFRRAVSDALMNGAGVDLLFFNLTPEAYVDRCFYQQVADVLKSCGVIPGRVCVEITEGAVYDEEVYKQSFLRWVDIGCYVALDDFGSGGSNVSLVVAAKPDYAKIDRSLVHGLAGNKRLQSALRSVLNLLFENDVFPIVEGVELPEDLAWLRWSQYDVGVQGFAVARPGPLSALVHQLKWGEAC